MSKPKELTRLTLFVEKAGDEKAHYGLLTTDPYLREHYFNRLMKMLKGKILNASDSTGTVNLTNGGKITIIVTKIRQVPEFMGFDVVYFDKSFDE